MQPCARVTLSGSLCIFPGRFRCQKCGPVCSRHSVAVGAKRVCTLCGSALSSAAGQPRLREWTRRLETYREARKYVRCPLAVAAAHAGVSVRKLHDVERGIDALPEEAARILWEFYKNIAVLNDEAEELGVAKRLRGVGPREFRETAENVS